MASRQSYNEEHGITPVGIKKEVRSLDERFHSSSAEGEEQASGAVALAAMPKEEIARLLKDLEAQMKRAAKELEFEKAAQLRDQIVELRRTLVE